MGKDIYIGVNGAARRIKDIYIGVNGVARRVTAGFEGVNDVARLFYQPVWYLASGLTNANVIAAFRFKGAGSIDIAMTDVSGHGISLERNGVAFDNNAGFIFNGLNHINANIHTFESCVVRYSDVTPTNGSLGPSAPLVPMSRNRFIAASLYYRAGWNTTLNPCVIYNGVIYYSNAGELRNGVLGTSGSSLFINGNQVATSASGIQESNPVYRTLGWGRIREDTTYISHRKIQAIVFYNIALTAVQQKQLYNQIIAL